MVRKRPSRSTRARPIGKTSSRVCKFDECAGELAVAVSNNKNVPAPPSPSTSAATCTARKDVPASPSATKRNCWSSPSSTRSLKRGQRRSRSIATPFSGKAGSPRAAYPWRQQRPKNTCLCESLANDTLHAPDRASQRIKRRGIGKAPQQKVAARAYPLHFDGAGPCIGRYSRRRTPRRRATPSISRAATPHAPGRRSRAGAAAACRQNARDRPS